MTEPNLSALTKMEQLVFGADAKKDAEGNIIEQGKGNLHDRVKKVEAALKAAVPNIAPETVAAIAQQSVLQSGAPTPAIPVSTVPPAAVTVAPAPVTPAPVAVAPTPVAPAPVVVPTSVIPVAPVTPATPVIPEPVTIEAVQAVVPDVHPSVVAAVIATNPKASHETIVAKLKAFLAEAESKIEEIL